MKTEIKIVDKSAIKVTDIKKILEKLDDYYIPPISSQVELSEYAEKIRLNAEILVIKYNKNTVGISAVYCNDYDDYTAFITTIGMMDKYQGQGLGKKLLEKSIDLAKSKGMRKIKLEVHENNNTAISFYKRNNFEIKEDRSCSSNNSSTQHWLVMEKTI